MAANVLSISLGYGSALRKCPPNRTEAIGVGASMGSVAQRFTFMIYELLFERRRYPR
jgi:hypothetical protein